MAIRPITGRLQQGSRYCARKNNNLRREFVETSMSWAGSVSGVLCCYLREEGESACMCLVSVLVIQPVLWCSVMWRFVLSATRSGNHHL